MYIEDHKKRNTISLSNPVDYYIFSEYFNYAAGIISTFQRTSLKMVFVIALSTQISPLRCNWVKFETRRNILIVAARVWNDVACITLTWINLLMPLSTRGQVWSHSVPSSWKRSYDNILMGIHKQHKDQQKEKEKRKPQKVK